MTVRGIEAKTFLTATIANTTRNTVLACNAEEQQCTCILCGSLLDGTLSGLTDTRFGTAGLYQAAKCVRCGLEQISPRPSLEELKCLYEERYNFGGESHSLYTRLRERFLFSSLYRFWTRIDGDISFHLRPGRGRLLDVGCNEGRGLQMYARNGYEVEGLELNERAAETARKKGFTVHTCPISDLAPANPYSIAILSNVLEHSLDPRQMLCDICKILDDNGQIWISCPNSKSWLRHFFGRSWINWHVPFHISHFSADTLERLLAETGFCHTEFHQITPALWLTQSVIAWMFARQGEQNYQLRNPFLTASLMLFSRFVLFPVLWFGNVSGRGDCLIAVAWKK